MTLSSFAYSIQKVSGRRKKPGERERRNENARDSIKLWKKERLKIKMLFWLICRGESVLRTVGFSTVSLV